MPDECPHTGKIVKEFYDEVWAHCKANRRFLAAQLRKCEPESMNLFLPSAFLSVDAVASAFLILELERSQTKGTHKPRKSTARKE